MAASRALAPATGEAGGVAAGGREGRGVAGAVWRGRGLGRGATRGLRGPTSQSCAPAGAEARASSEAMIQARGRALTVAV